MTWRIWLYIAIGLMAARLSIPTIMRFARQELGELDTFTWVLGTVSALFAGLIWPAVLVIGMFYVFVVAPIRREMEKRHDAEIHGRS